jgi:hypothetical protein
VTYEALPGCRGPKGDPCSGDGHIDMGLTTPLHAIGWAVVACLLVYLVLKLWKRSDDALPVIGLGCGFWLLLWLAIGWLGLSGGGFGVVLVPIMAFGLAWAMVVRRSNEEGAR